MDDSFRKTVQAKFYVNEIGQKLFKAHCERTGKSMSDIINKFILKYVDKHETS